MRFITTIGIGGVLLGAACMDAGPVAPATPATEVAATSEVGDVAVGGYRARLLSLAPEQVGSSEALAVNNRGVIGGYVYRHYRDANDYIPNECPSPRYTAVLYRGSVIQSLHEAVADALSQEAGWRVGLCHFESVVTDVNDHDEVVGVWWPSEHEPQHRSGFYWSPSTGVVLAPTDDRYPSSELAAINNEGIVTGDWLDNGFYPIALRWNPGAGVFSHWPAFDLPYSSPFAIAENSTVAGCVDGYPFVADKRGSAVLYDQRCSGTSYSQGEFVKRQRPGGVNSSGMAVLSVESAGPVMWDSRNSATPVPLGWGAGAAFAISERGRTVGRSDRGPSVPWIAVTRASDGSIVYLPDAVAGAPAEALAVNDCGTIVGFTETSDRYRHRATIWTKEGCDPPLK